MEQRKPEVTLEAFLDALPVDDEPLTDEELADAEAGWAEYERGDFVVLSPTERT
jgi:hypothetical protein